MLGTNPMAIAIPGLEEPPVVIDFTAGALAFGEVVPLIPPAVEPLREVAAGTGVPFPKGEG